MGFFFSLVEINAIDRRQKKSIFFFLFLLRVCGGVNSFQGKKHHGMEISYYGRKDSPKFCVHEWIQMLVYRARGC